MHTSRTQEVWILLLARVVVVYFELVILVRVVLATTLVVVSVYERIYFAYSCSSIRRNY